MNQYKIINQENWIRAMHCKAFRNSVKPTIGITFEVDITNFKSAVRTAGLSFTMAMTYVVCKCANQIEAFRYRFLDGEVVLYEQIDTAFTFLEQETELFKVVNVPLTQSIQEYCRLASKTVVEQKEYFAGELRNDVFQCSSIPWVTYTSISHTSSGKKDNAVPTFDWGKYYEKEGKIKMIMSLQAHHSFVDGVHMGRFVETLQQYLEEFTL